MHLEQSIDKILINKEQLQTRITELGAQISKDYAGKNPLLAAVLRGSIMFMGDLLKNITIPCTIDFLGLSSYCGSQSSGEVRFMLDLRDSIKDRHVIIIEDIVDTGLTLDYLLKNLKTRGASSVEICALLDKPENRKTKVSVKYTGFKIANEFVVGYGLDYNELYRNLPYIGVYKADEKE